MKRALAFPFALLPAFAALGVTTNRTETVIRPGFTRVDLVCNDTPCWRAYMVKVDLGTRGLRFDVVYPGGNQIGTTATLTAMNSFHQSALDARYGAGKAASVVGINGDFFGGGGYTQRLNVRNGGQVQSGYNPSCGKWGAGTDRLYETADGRFHQGAVTFSGSVSVNGASYPIGLLNTMNYGADRIGSGVAVYLRGCRAPFPATGVKVRFDGPFAAGGGATVKDKPFTVIGPVAVGGRAAGFAADEGALVGLSGTEQAAIAAQAAGTAGTLTWGFAGVEGTSDVRNLVGVWLDVLKDGAPVPSTDQNESLAAKPRGYPRTCVGLSAKNNQVVLLVSDGRQDGWSKHMTTRQVAEILRAEGCENAGQFDGGGSTEMVVNGKVVNRPSDGRERPLATAMFFSVVPARGPRTRAMR